MIWKAGICILNSCNIAGIQGYGQHKMVGHNYVPHFSVTVEDSLVLTSGNHLCALQYKM